MDLIRNTEVTDHEEDNTILEDKKDDEDNGGVYYLLGDGNDVVFSGPDGDIVVGGNGQDYLRGGEGADSLIGGGMVSEFYQEEYGYASEYTETGLVYLVQPRPSELAETIVGGAGNDVIIGGGWFDYNADGEFSVDELLLDGNQYSNDPRFDPVIYTSEQMYYSPGYHNIVWAGEGDDFVYGADGYDTIGGGDGDDFLYGFGSADVIFGGAGNDKIWGGDGDVTSLFRMDGNNVVITEQLFGGAGNDYIYGEGGVDNIYGGTGSDKIWGGEGDDSLHGGEGADAFSFGYRSGNDIITDFDVTEDTLYFETIEQQVLVDELLQHADEQVVDGQGGLMIHLLTGDSVFLVGLTTDDIESISANAGPLITGDV